MLAGCSTETEEQTEYDFPISIRNTRDDDHEVAIVLHDLDRDERPVNEVMRVPADERDSISVTIERDGEDWPGAWFLVGVDLYDGFDELTDTDVPSDLLDLNESRTDISEIIRENNSIGVETSDNDLSDSQYVETTIDLIGPGLGFALTIDSDGSVQIYKNMV
ncbi:hypothetical protein AArc1_3466 [Natrarchaeobaculum sulfurireducens]|uniref:Uncharacterized protein n=1 Tax=Natrarchaeobaculum sulfurireducens TaxID=2044521 RepID=A0A346PJR4_9EURY|nr:hypothetical protein AArc1_3466 [Natrarchaeobaculum sulfurireducens]